MIFGAQDWVAGLTSTVEFKMDPKDILLIPMPESTAPEKYKMYTGGNGIWFSPTATDEQIIAALEYYTHFGILSGWNEEIETSYRAQMDAMIKNNRVELPPYPVYTDDSYQKKVDILKADYMNHFDFEKQFGYFYQRVNEATASYEEDGDVQNMFRIVISVMQELYVNEKADLDALMETANDQYQSLLDSMK